VVVVLWQSLQSGRLRYLPAASQEPDRYVEIEGPPDVVVEIVSDSSIGKDTPIYARAGLPELWLEDVRKERMRLDIHTLREGRYEVVEPESAGWRRSPRLEQAFRLVRRKTPIGSWSYRLEQGEGPSQDASDENAQQGEFSQVKF